MTPIRLTSQAEADQLLERFLWCGDDVVERFLLDWDLSKCVVRVLTADLSDPVGTKYLTFEVSGLTSAFWYPKWKGYVECGELRILIRERQVCISVGGDHDHYQKLSDVTMDSTSFFAIGSEIAYSIEDSPKFQ